MTYGATRTIGSLFSGIGMLERGLELAGVGRTVWQVERDEFCRRVLAARNGGVAIHTDVRRVGASALAAVDVICGGFPCQDVSSTAGSGVDGPRSSLVWEFLRVVNELRPRAVVVENVGRLRTRGLDRILGALAALGYDAIWLTLDARWLGGAVRRERLFIVAFPHVQGSDVLAEAWLHAHRAPRDDADRRGDRVPGPTDADGWDRYRRTGGPEPGVLRGAAGYPSRLDVRRLAAVGNSVHVGQAETIGWITRYILDAQDTFTMPVLL